MYQLLIYKCVRFGAKMNIFQSVVLLRVSSLLGAFCSAVEPDFFYTCLWQCVCSGSSIRLPSVTFLLSQFNRKLSMEDQLHFMGLDIDLMVSCVLLSSLCFLCLCVVMLAGKLDGDVHVEFLCFALIFVTKNNDNG